MWPFWSQPLLKLTNLTITVRKTWNSFVFAIYVIRLPYETFYNKQLTSQQQSWNMLQPALLSYFCHKQRGERKNFINKPFYSCLLPNKINAYLLVFSKRFLICFDLRHFTSDFDHNFLFSENLGSLKSPIWTGNKTDLSMKSMSKYQEAINYGS